MTHPEIVDTINRYPQNMGISGVDWLSRPGNIPVAFPNGDLALFEKEGAGEYEAHFLMVSRGREAINNARKAFAAMFDEHGAELIFGLVAATRRDVRLFARWAGAKHAGSRQTNYGPCDLFVISRDMRKRSS